MPKSALKTTELPFLNRFEKYILSVEDALQAKLQSQNRRWEHINVNDPNVKSKSIFTILEEGCNDMIQRLHIENHRERLLYGLVPKETVASLLYSVVEHSVETQRSTAIPPAFVVESSVRRRATPVENVIKLDI